MTVPASCEVCLWREAAPQNGELPSDPQQKAPSDAEAMQKALSQFIIAPRAQASRPAPGLNRGRCETTSVARRQAAKLCYRFGPLTRSARSANLIAEDGTKNGFPAPNKEPATNQKQPLDRKSPIQVRIRLPPAKSLQTLGPLRLGPPPLAAQLRWRSAAGRLSLSRPHAAVLVAWGIPSC